MAYSLSAEDLIEEADSIFRADGTAACPYSGHAFLYSGPDRDIFANGNIVDYRMSNHQRAKSLAPIFGAVLVDDMNVSKLLLNNIDGTGLGIYDYYNVVYDGDIKLSFSQADRVMRHVSARYIGDLWGEVTTSVCGTSRTRIFYDTELPRMGHGAYDVMTGLAKSKDIRVVNDGPIGEIRKLYRQNVLELAYRIVCINEIDKLARTAWELASQEIMRHCLDVQEFYMIDRQKMWGLAEKQICEAKVHTQDLMRLDRKLNNEDRAKRRSPEYCFGSPERLTEKEQRLFLFVIRTMAHKALPAQAINS